MIDKFKRITFVDDMEDLRSSSDIASIMTVLSASYEDGRLEKYLSLEFNWQQLAEIQFGIKNGLSDEQIERLLPQSHWL